MFFYTDLDKLIQFVAERFRQLLQNNLLFGFLYDIYSIKNKSNEDIAKDCKN